PGPGANGLDVRDHLRRAHRDEARHDELQDGPVGDLYFDGAGLPGDGPGRAGDPLQDLGDRSAGEMPPEGAGGRVVVRESPHGQLSVRAPRGPNPARRATREPAFTGPEE